MSAVGGHPPAGVTPTIITMQTKTQKITVGQLAAALVHLRRRVVRILDDAHRLGSDQRKLRLTRDRWATIGRSDCGNMGPLVVAHGTRVAGELAELSVELVCTGNEILALSVQINASTTPAERLDLLGAGRRRGFYPGVDQTFAGLVGMSLERPQDRRGRKVAGPLVVGMAAACGAAMKRNAEASRAAERHVTERVTAAGFIFSASPTLQ